VRKKGLHIVTAIPSWHSSHYLAEANISNKERKVFKKKKKERKVEIERDQIREKEDRGSALVQDHSWVSAGLLKCWPWVFLQ
jgi:hypothetical protein